MLRFLEAIDKRPHHLLLPKKFVVNQKAAEKNNLKKIISLYKKIYKEERRCFKLSYYRIELFLTRIKYPQSKQYPPLLVSCTTRKHATLSMSTRKVTEFQSVPLQGTNLKDLTANSKGRIFYLSLPRGLSFEYENQQHSTA